MEGQTALSSGGETGLKVVEDSSRAGDCSTRICLRECVCRAVVVAKAGDNKDGDVLCTAWKR